MTNKRNRKKQLQRAAPQYTPGGGLMYVPVGQQQGTRGTVFYGNSMKNIPVGTEALFSSGVPLPPQPNVDPLGKPVQFRYPVSVNTWQVDRTMGKPDIPGFEQLRRFARMYSGCTLNERYWLDLVPRMTLDIRIKKQYADQGAEVKDYQKEITALKTFWEKPDGRHDLHTWIRMNFREQSQIDELYWYKNRTRGRKLLGLWIVDGAQMKPLLDDWGMLPESPDYAYQQYPWGIPGMQYSTDQMIHYQETPAAETPYGFSRVERIIMEVNQALRKKRKDLSNFTEGNIPQSFMEVPESMNWTPDQIDAYEQSWNALMAGQPQQQIRMKFLQPGMKYIPAEQYQMLTDFDLFLFKLTCAVYGVPVTEFGFTEDSNRSSGESQEDMVYRRTIGPLAMAHARLMTDVHATDFPDIHGEMFEAYFSGYEELEDEESKATTLTTYAGAGILGLTDAAKMANLPIDPDAPPIGRVIISPTSGPIFLDDVATPEMRKAQADATMAGYQLAANPPPPAEQPPEDGKEPPASGQKAAKPAPKDDAQPDEKAAMSRVVEALAGIDEQLRLLRARNVTPMEDDDMDVSPGTKEYEYVERTQPSPESQTGRDADTGRRTDETTRARMQLADLRTEASGQDRREVGAEYRRWRTRAIEDVKAGRTIRPFTSTLISVGDVALVRDGLATCETADDVRAVFERARERQEHPFVTASTDHGSNSGGNQPPSKSAWKLRW